MASLWDFLSRIPLAISTGFAWDRAREFSTKDDPLGALRVIESIPAREGERPEWQLLKLQQHFNLKDDAAVARELPVVLAAVGASNRLNGEEKQYLEAYARWLAMYDAAGVPTPDQDDAKPFYAAVSQIDLSKVAQFFRVAFPLRCHPGWVELKA